MPVDKEQFLAPGFPEILWTPFVPDVIYVETNDGWTRQPCICSCQYHVRPEPKQILLNLFNELIPIYSLASFYPWNCPTGISSTGPGDQFRPGARTTCITITSSFRCCVRPFYLLGVWPTGWFKRQKKITQPTGIDVWNWPNLKKLSSGFKVWKHNYSGNYVFNSVQTPLTVQTTK